MDDILVYRYNIPLQMIYRCCYWLELYFSLLLTEKLGSYCIRQITHVKTYKTQLFLYESDIVIDYVEMHYVINVLYMKRNYFSKNYCCTAFQDIFRN